MPMIGELEGPPEESEVEIVDAQLDQAGDGSVPGGQNGSETPTVEDSRQSTVTSTTAPQASPAADPSSPADDGAGHGTAGTGSPDQGDSAGANGSEGKRNGSTAGDWLSRIDAMDDEELALLQSQIDNGEIPVEAPPSADDDDEIPLRGKPDPTPDPQKAQATPPADPQIEGTEEADEPEQSAAANLEKPTRFRLKPKSELDEEVFKILKNNPDLELADALPIARKRLGIEDATPAQAAAPEAAPAPNGEAPAPQETPDDGLPNSLAEARDALQRAREARDKAQFEDYDADEARKQQALVDQLYDHIGELRVHAEKAEIEAQERAARAEGEMLEQYHASASEAAKLYPAAAQANSAFALRMHAIDQALIKGNDPLANDPQKPLRIAQMVAAEMGIAPSTAGPAPKPAPRPAPASSSQASPAPAPQAPAASGTARTAPVAGSATLLQRIDAVEDVDDLNDLEADLRARGLL